MEKRVTKPTCPCTPNCKRRTEACMLTCVKYKIYRVHRDKYYKQRIKDNEAANAVHEHQMKARKRFTHGAKYKRKKD